MAARGLSEVKNRAAAAAARCGRQADEVTIVAVSKTVGPEEILEAYRHGHRDFGENRAHELAAKAPLLPADIRWHFVGSLQSRKVRDVAPLAGVIHSIDRVSVLKALGRVGYPGKLLLQVNLAHEEQKHGADPAEVGLLLEAAADQGLEIGGLMVMPPLVADPEENRIWFHRLRELRTELQPNWPALAELSMGMTDDFEVGIEEGATLIRVGRAIFGA